MMAAVTSIRCSSKRATRRRVVYTLHSLKRLCDKRQSNVTHADVMRAALSVPGYVPVATKFRNFRSEQGQYFDLIFRDSGNERIIITIIGK